jgi:hypothetical protein
MMISRPMPAHPAVPTPKSLGHSEEPMQPVKSLNPGPNPGYPAPMIRYQPFAFNPRALPPVNLVRGPRRPNG